MSKRSHLLIVVSICILLILTILLLAMPYMATPIDQYYTIESPFLLPILSVTLFIGSIASIAVWIFALVKAVQHKSLSETEKICWVLIILFANLLGAFLFLIIANRKQTLC